MLANHHSLMSPWEFLHFIIALRERRKSLPIEGRLLYKLALSSFVEENLFESWNMRFLGDKRLHYINKFFKFKQRKRYRFSGSALKVNGSLIRACRNIAVHYRSYGPEAEFSPIGVGLTMKFLFGDFIDMVYFRLGDSRLLDHFLEC